VAITKVSFSSEGNGGEVFCGYCGKSMGACSWEELIFLARSERESSCFDCETDGASDLYPKALVMALEDAWRVVVDGTVFYGEWVDCVSPVGVVDERFLIPWGEMLIREQARCGGFIELPRSWFEGGEGMSLPCLVSANLKNIQDGDDYCEA